MAVLIPSDVFEGTADHHAAELATLKTLQTGLPDTLTVFHGVHWSSVSRFATRYGEIDFLVVDESGRIVVIEQKNGLLEEDDNGLYKRYDGTRRKSVGDQIQRSLDAIRTKFASQNPGEGGLFVNCLLYCPDHRVLRVNGSALDETRVVDASARDGLGPAIESLFTDERELELPDPERVHAFFHQSLDVVPDVAGRIGLNETRYTRLAGGLSEIVEGLSFEPYRLRIQGIAGCGKTLAAHRIMERWLDRGRTPLYVCFNRVLRDALLSQFPTRADAIHTFHGLCHAAREAAGVPVVFTDADDHTFWDELVDSVLGLDIPDALKFDALIIDEGQDFRAHWFEVLRLFLTDDYEMLWLEDPNQNVFAIEPIETPALVTYRADTSYRTPRSIATFIETTLGIPIECGTGLPGLGVGVTTHSGDRQLIKRLEACINMLRRDGFDNDHILILTCSSFRHSAIYECDTLAGVGLRRFLHYDTETSEPIFSDGHLRFDSVLRFKGGHAPAVILIDAAATAHSAGDTRRLLFCGMTRATVRLELLVDAESPLAEPLAGGQRIPETIK
ncbi:hypothetical protein S4A8_03168 [Salinisphaera sp. S4-8]|uniref:ATP-binding domain-containing protein n=1 Tax=Salinisphaera sp. S4-8 TaxID=633357 RepID=UPI00334042BA